MQFEGVMTHIVTPAIYLYSWGRVWDLRFFFFFLCFSSSLLNERGTYIYTILFLSIVNNLLASSVGVDIARYLEVTMNFNAFYFTCEL